ncbi:MAG: YebC/PmpR family DNA-binding transcriptional regulator [Anaerolineaceae bacterium]|jgi:YebC/PmpR family DNA-binding regulatory protein|nr:YebC/PmpR family DNA-binding transcriptional regulator [Anaerolineales bacterium]MEB2333945.1 YebC/PmpR family DNA-binding transcriptional regulator [Anaerolineaceae bacterium]OQY89156.1 MAG: YebC/PmpR family DNA-binding transcriptional regulator [Anaerolineae bacterium UTCFX1]
MSGHSKWSTIKRKKGVADAKRGAVFTRLAREIVIAAREGGSDVDSNFRLRLAVDKARAENMPKDNIERAIKRGAGEDKDSAAFESIMYEGYAPHGVAVMVETVTDNRNRTVSDLRHAFSKAGGNMAELGAVGWQFERIAYFSFPSNAMDFDKAFELGIEAGANDVAEDDGTIEITAPVEAFKVIADALHKANVAPDEAGLRMNPKQEIELGAEDAAQVLRALENIEDLDDVQNVYSNLKVSDEALAALEIA